jgi:hypothetical protein
MPAQADTAVNHSRRQAAGRSWNIAAALLTAAVSVALMFLPLISTADSSGATDRQSLVAQSGWGAVLGLAVPVLVAVAPLLVPARHRRWATIVAATLLTLGALVSAASVGLFYLPSAALLVVSAVRTRRPAQ